MIYRCFWPSFFFIFFFHLPPDSSLIFPSILSLSVSHSADSLSDFNLHKPDTVEWIVFSEPVFLMEHNISTKHIASPINDSTWKSVRWSLWIFLFSRIFKIVSSTIFDLVQLYRSSSHWSSISNNVQSLHWQSSIDTSQPYTDCSSFKCQSTSLQQQFVCFSTNDTDSTDNDAVKIDCWPLVIWMVATVVFADWLLVHLSR